MLRQNSRNKALVKKFGWFEIAGVQRGQRHIRDQLKGLGPLFDEAKGKSILDLGSAEGLVAKALLDAGAKHAECVEQNADYAAEARAQLKGRPAVVHLWDLNNGLPGTGPADIVLMLAILHKLKKPITLLSQVIEQARPALAVIRYPRNNDGIIVDGRSHFEPQDIPGYMVKSGYRCTHKEMGPQRELTAYFRRTQSESPVTSHESRA